jgi:hypothetical protein
MGMKEPGAGDCSPKIYVFPQSHMDMYGKSHLPGAKKLMK